MMKMQETTTGKLYDLWSRIYDHSFGKLVHRRQIRALEELRPQPGQRVLDLGVGTGLTLKHYPDNITVVGMDLSAGMLKKAAEKIDDQQLGHCQLIQGDAMQPPFADQSFDHIIITHTISVVSNPQRLLHWVRKMIKPGGRIVVLNHFQSTNPLFGWCEKIANPICVKIGWRSDLSLEECLRDVDLSVHYQFKMNPLDVWKIVVLSDQPLGRDAARPAAKAAEDRAQNDEALHQARASA